MKLDSGLDKMKTGKEWEKRLVQAHLSINFPNNKEVIFPNNF